MKFGCRVLFFMLVSAVGVRLVECQTRQPALSSEPLTREQISIYHLVIANYLKGSSEKLNIASTTETADQAGLSFDYHCMKDAETKGSSPRVVHSLNPLLANKPQLVMVESDRQQEQIEKNDPQSFVAKAVEGHRDVSDDELKQSVRRAFEVGLFSLSEIIFDKRHLNAVVAYSFVCGGLCGNGNTVMLKKTGQKWKIYKRCGGWVS